MGNQNSPICEIQALRTWNLCIIWGWVWYKNIYEL